MAEGVRSSENLRKTRGCVYSSFVRNAILHASGAWPLTKPDLKRLPRNDRSMIRPFCNVKSENVAITRSNNQMAQLEIDDLDVILGDKKLRWFGHIERSSGAIKTAWDIQKDGERGQGRSKMSCKILKERDRRA